MLLPEEKHAVAVHEAGHALVAALSDNADPVSKVTILPAGQALGVTQQLPLVERHLYGEDYLHDSLAVRLGGRAAELVELGQGSTGAANDLASATDLATKMVREFGLSAELGPVGYPEGGSVFLGGGGQAMSSRPFAEATQAAIDREVARLLREAEENAIGKIRSHRAELGPAGQPAAGARDRGRLRGVPDRGPDGARAPGGDDGRAARRRLGRRAQRGVAARGSSDGWPGRAAAPVEYGAMPLLVLSDADVRQLLSYPDCVTVVRAALAGLAQGRAGQPLRSLARLAGAPGLLGLMPAYLAAGLGSEPGPESASESDRMRGPTASRSSPSTRPTPAGGWIPTWARSWCSTARPASRGRC